MNDRLKIDEHESQDVKWNRGLDIDKTIKIILEFLSKGNEKNISIIDARINNQIIING